MSCMPIEDASDFQEATGLPGNVIVYFFEENPGPEFRFLINDDYPGNGEFPAFFVNISQADVERDLSSGPVTVLYEGGSEVDHADVGDIEKLFQLCERAAGN